MIEHVAQTAAVALKKAAPTHEASVEVLKYSLIIMIQGIVIVVLSLLIGWLTGAAFSTLITIIAFVLLRLVSGGIHLNSSFACTFVSIALMTTLPHIPLTYEWNVGLMATSCLLAILYAPSRIDGNTRIDRKHYPILKLVSIGLISVNFVIMSPTLTLAFFAQSITLPYRRKNSW